MTTNRITSWSANYARNLTANYDVARHAWTAPFRPSKLAKQQGCFLDEDWTNGRYVTHDVICSKNRTGSTTLNNTYAQYAALGTHRCARGISVYVTRCAIGQRRQPALSTLHHEARTVL